MSNSDYVKPIKATPTLSKKCTAEIIKETMIKPSQESIERNREMLKIRKSITYN